MQRDSMLRAERVLLVAFALAIIPSVSWVSTVGPSPTVENQLLATFGWAAVAAVAAREQAIRVAIWFLPLAAGTLLYVASALLDWSSGRTLPGDATSVALILLDALFLSWTAARMPASFRRRATDAFFFVLVIAGLGQAIVSIVQVFAPGMTDDRFIAAATLHGRAIGNLRQPNQLAALLVWGCAALTPLWLAGRLSRLVAHSTAALFGLVIALTGSRTGLVGLALLGTWAFLDRRPRRDVRLLQAVPLAWTIAGLGLLWLYAHMSGTQVGDVIRLADKDLSASRFALWRNVVLLLQENPLHGVGVGNFNVAWTLSVMPNRPPALFDNAHNIVLQLAVEVGLPLAALIIGAFSASLTIAVRKALRAPEQDGARSSATLIMILFMLFYSMVEYPLWYAYFLLPFFWLLGTCLGGWESAANLSVRVSRYRVAALAILCILIGSGAIAADLDYRRMSAIFPPGDSRPLGVRVEIGRRSPLYSKYADYVRATGARDPMQRWQSLRSAVHVILDPPLMESLAETLEQTGHPNEARYVAARLAEFPREDTKPFFAVCAPGAASGVIAFQCETPTAPVDWRSMVRGLSQPNGSVGAS